MSEAPLKKPILGVAIVTLLLLLIPGVAMQFKTEVAWGPGDFVVAALLLFGAGSAAVLGFRHVRGVGRRAALICAIASGLALVWAELAVGLFN